MVFTLTKNAHLVKLDAVTLAVSECPISDGYLLIGISGGHP